MQFQVVFSDSGGGGHHLSPPLSDRFLGRESELSVSLGKHPPKGNLPRSAPRAPEHHTGRVWSEEQGFPLGRGRRIRVLPLLPTRPWERDGAEWVQFLRL